MGGERSRGAQRYAQHVDEAQQGEHLLDAEVVVNCEDCVLAALARPSMCHHNGWASS